MGLLILQNTAILTTPTSASDIEEARRTYGTSG